MPKPALAEATRRIALAGQAVDYQLRRSRRRPIGLAIDQRGLSVGAPLQARLGDIESLIREHGQWILDKLADWRSRPTPERLVVSEGAVIFALAANSTACRAILRGGCSRSVSSRALARSESTASSETATELEAEELMESVVADVAVLAERHGVTVRVVAAEEQLIEGDPVALQRMLVVLIDNAIRHGGAGEVRVATRAGARHVLYSVEDDGPGIDGADMARVLGRFERGRTRAPGSGLGLAIARRIAKAHGGEIPLARGERGGLRVTARISARRA